MCIISLARPPFARLFFPKRYLTANAKLPLRFHPGKSRFSAPTSFVSGGIVSAPSPVDGLSNSAYGNALGLSSFIVSAVRGVIGKGNLVGIRGATTAEMPQGDVRALRLV